MTPPSSTSEDSIWHIDINRAIHELNANNKDECIAILDNLLVNHHGTLPIPWRMRAQILMSKANDDWFPAEDYKNSAELTWVWMRRRLPKGVDEEFDAVLVGLRRMLNEHSREMEAAMPDEIRALIEGREEEVTAEAAQATEAAETMMLLKQGENVEESESSDSSDSSEEEDDEEEYDCHVGFGTYDPSPVNAAAPAHDNTTGAAAVTITQEII
jgi:hypothetical protein